MWCTQTRYTLHVATSIQLSARAVRDLRRIGPGSEAERLRVALRSLAEGASNLDVKAIADHPGWRRLRVGDWRVLYVGLPDGGVWVERIVGRGDLERGIASL